MKELYVEGLASHGGHESCAGDRKVTREALTVGIRSRPSGRSLSAFCEENGR